MQKESREALFFVARIYCEAVGADAYIGPHDIRQHPDKRRRDSPRGLVPLRFAGTRTPPSSTGSLPYVARRPEGRPPYEIPRSFP